MKFTLRIDCGNAAFGESWRQLEVARILSDTAKRIEYGAHESGNLRDVNGNTVGSFKFTGTHKE